MFRRCSKSSKSRKYYRLPFSHTTISKSAGVCNVQPDGSWKWAFSLAHLKMLNSSARSSSFALNTHSIAAHVLTLPARPTTLPTNRSGSLNYTLYLDSVRLPTLGLHLQKRSWVWLSKYFWLLIVICGIYDRAVCISHFLIKLAGSFIAFPPDFQAKPKTLVLRLAINRSDIAPFISNRPCAENPRIEIATAIM